jgi:hypothetical protein
MRLQLSWGASYVSREDGKFWRLEILFLAHVSHAGKDQIPVHARLSWNVHKASPASPRCIFSNPVALSVPRCASQKDKIRVRSGLCCL